MVQPKSNDLILVGVWGIYSDLMCFLNAPTRLVNFCKLNTLFYAVLAIITQLQPGFQIWPVPEFTPLQAGWEGQPRPLSPDSL